MAQKKLTPDEQLQVCQWLAMRYSSAKVAELCLEEFEVSMNRSNIYGSYQNSPKWKPTIEKLRDEYLTERSKIPIAVENERLIMCQKIYRESMAKGDMSSAIKAVEQARKEVKGDLSLPVGTNFMLEWSNNGNGSGGNGGGNGAKKSKDAKNRLQPSPGPAGLS